MPRHPEIHRAVNGRGEAVWRFRFQGKSYVRAAYADAATTYAKVVGESARAEKPVVVAQLVDRWLEIHPTEFHRSSVSQFGDWLGDMEIQQVQPDLLIRFKAWLEAQTFTRRRGRKTVKLRYGPETIRKRIHAAASVMRPAVKSGSVPALEFPACPSPVAEPKAMAPIELGVAILKMQQSPRSRHVADLVRFALDTGARPGELRSLKWAQVDLQRGALILPQHKTAKRTARPRVIIVPPTAVNRLRDMERRGEYVFGNRSGNPYTGAGLRATLRRYGIRPNQLRHSFAQTMIDANVRPEVVTEALGHRTSRMVWTYAAVKAERVRAAFAGMPTTSELASQAAASQLPKQAQIHEAGYSEKCEPNQRVSKRGRSGKRKVG